MEILALYAAGTVAACQLLDLGNGHEVVVTLDRVLECRCCNCELDCILGVLAAQQRVDQTLSLIHI